MVGHAIEAFHLDAHTHIPAITNHDIEHWYEQVGGYIPGKPETDRGTDNNVLIEHWRRGLLTASGGSHQIAASLYVDPQDGELCRRAIWEFVILFRSVGLPVTARGQKVWDVDPNASGEDQRIGSWGYHDIPYLSYDRSCWRPMALTLSMRPAGSWS